MVTNKKHRTHRLGKQESNLIFRLLATSDSLEHEKLDRVAESVVSTRYRKYVKDKSVQGNRPKRDC